MLLNRRFAFMRCGTSGRVFTHGAVLRIVCIMATLRIPVFCHLFAFYGTFIPSLIVSLSACILVAKIEGISVALICSVFIDLIIIVNSFGRL